MARAVGIDVERIRTDLDPVSIAGRGIGLSLPLDQFDVSSLPNEEPQLLATRHDPAEARWWRLQALDLSGDYAGALAAPSWTAAPRN